MKTVLIVDDAGFMRMALKLMLERNGFEVIGEADDGEVAVKQYQLLKPDLVTMDITMGEMSGVEALKKIKSIDKDAYVVMVSAMGQESVVREAIMAGAKGFIVKPFVEETIIKGLK